MKRFFTVKTIVLSAMIAAIYTALTMLLQPFSFAAQQVRIAEALTLLPFLIPEAIPGLAIGCFLSNLLGGFGLPDMIFGTLATLIAAYLTYKSKHYLIGAIYPVVLNAVIVGAVITVAEAGFNFKLYLINALSVGAGQAIACYALGVPLLLGIKKVLDKLKKAG